MKFAKCLGIFILLAGMPEFSSCVAVKHLEGVWLGTERGSQAVACILEIKADKFVLYFENVLHMNTSFKLQGDLPFERGKKVKRFPFL